MASWQSSSAAIWAAAKPCSDSSTITARVASRRRLADRLPATQRHRLNPWRTRWPGAYWPRRRRWLDGVGNLDPTSGEADVTSVTHRSHSGLHP